MDWCTRFSVGNKEILQEDGVQTAAIFFGGQGPSGAASNSISYDGSSFSGIPSMNHNKKIL